MSKLGQIIKKDFKSFFRFKSNLLLFVFYPLLVLIIFFLVFSMNQTSLVNVGYMSQDVVFDIKDSNLNLIKYESLKTCSKDLVLGNIQACLNDNMVIYDNTKSNLYYYLSSVLPEQFVLKSYTNKQDLFLANFIAIIIMFLTIFFASSNLVVEKNSNTLIRNKITGTSEITFLLGRIFSTTLIVLIQLLIIFILISIFIRTNLFSNIYFYIILIFTSILFTLIGLLIGYLSSSFQNSAIFSIIVSLLTYMGSFEFLSRIYEISTSFVLISPYSITYRLFRNLLLANYFNLNLFFILILHILIFGLIVWFVMHMMSSKILHFKKREVLDD